MKLTKKDKDFLFSCGHTKQDFPQIEEATHRTKIKYDLDGKLIGREKRFSFLGARNIGPLSHGAFSTGRQHR